MSLVGKIFKLPANRQRAHDEYFKVERENFGILVCTMLVPDRPHHKITNLICDPSELQDAEEITTKEYLEAMEKTA